MNSNIRPVWMEVDLDSLVHNLREVKKNLKPPASVIGVVKADGYGHGAVEVARVLLEEGVDRLAVAVLDEGMELRNAGIEVPILNLGYTPPYHYDLLCQYDVTPTIYNYDDAVSLSRKAAEKKRRIKIHIKLDTGMGRIGFIPGKDSLEAVSKIYNLDGIIIEGIFTHFSVADIEDKSYTYMQYRKYIDFCNKLADRGINIPIKHVCNSAAIIDHPDMHLDMVRPGIILYGYFSDREVRKDLASPRPVASLKARISHVKTIPAGASVGYGRKFIAYRETVVATLPLGYADGYSRILSGKANVLVKGREVPVIGNICMDQCMIDVTEIEGVEVGEEVVLMGSQGGRSITALDLAGLMGTIQHEVLCGISKRVPRVYIKDGKAVKVRYGAGR